MTHAEAIARATKLLRLAQSDNANEAAVAAAMAQKIIDDFRLSSALLEENPEGRVEQEPIRDFGHSPVEEKGTTWRIRLLQILSDANQCSVYRRGGKALALIGRASDVETVRYMYQHLSKEVDRLTHREGHGNGKTWCNNFRLGVCDTIGQRMREEHEKTAQDAQAKGFAQSGETGLVLVNKALARVEARKAEVTRWVDQNMKLKAGRTSQYRGDYGAREAGRAAGREISLGQKRGALGS